MDSTSQPSAKVDGLPPRPLVAADELTLGDAIYPLWNGRRVLIATAFVFGAVTFAVTSMVRPMYAAVAVIRSIESRSADTAEPAKAENFRPLLESKTIAASLVKDFALVSQPRFVWSAVGGPMSYDAFLRDALRVDQVIGTNLLRVRVTLSDPALAAKVTNALVDRAIEFNRSINQQEVIEARDYIKSQLDEATARLDDVRAKLIAGKQKAQVDALRKDVEGALEVRSRLPELEASIENERAFLASSEADLAKSSQMLTTRRSIDRDPALMEAARGQDGKEPVLGLTMTDESVNTAYAALQEQVSSSRAALAGLENQRKLLVGEKKLDRTIGPAITRLYQGDVEVERLQAEFDMVLRLYTTLSTRYEEARLNVGGRRAQLQVVDPAVPPSAPVGSDRLAAVALAMVSGLLLASAVMLARKFLAAREPE